MLVWIDADGTDWYDIEIIAYGLADKYTCEGIVVEIKASQRRLSS